MKRVRFLATIYKHEELDYPESAVLLPEELKKESLKLEKSLKKR